MKKRITLPLTLLLAALIAFLALRKTNEERRRVCIERAVERQTALSTYTRNELGLHVVALTPTLPNKNYYCLSAALALNPQWSNHRIAVTTLPSTPVDLKEALGV